MHHARTDDEGEMGEDGGCGQFACDGMAPRCYYLRAGNGSYKLIPVGISFVFFTPL